MNFLRSTILTAASLALGVVLACALPLAALTTAAARTLPARFAYGVVIFTWLADQTIGFCFRHYPTVPSTYGWGVAIGSAALAATAAARRARTWAFGFVAAFVVDQLVLTAYGAFDHDLSSFSASIVAKIALGNVIGLMILGPLALAPGLVTRSRADSPGAGTAR